MKKKKNQNEKPNILFILVDELRFPSVFPKEVNDPGEFFQHYMPNVHRLWKRGVKFSNYHTAASACTPARGTLLTGLYSQQSWLCCTLTAAPTATPTNTEPDTHAPTLDPAFPTYGSLLREAGYRTPYIGKWHVSLLEPEVKGLGLEKYGFDGKVYADPVGYNLQGTVGSGTDYPNDQDIANAAVDWFNEERNDDSDKPWCLTVSFVNPHDREFFWAGTEFEKYNELMGSSPPAFTLYSQESGAGAPQVNPADNPLKTPNNPEALPYPDATFTYDFPNNVPPNWESAETMKDNKPSAQYMNRLFQACVWGGASDDEFEAEFTKPRYPRPLKAPFRIGTAPYHYWKRGLDSYTQIREYVDTCIGQVLDAMPESELDNTVIVFASDHGEYSGAHGFLSGKLGSAYKEAYNVPLVVVDPRGQFTAEEEVVRDGLVSSVDFLRMIVSMGHNGDQGWLKAGDNEQLYGQRHDIMPMLKSSEAPGRDYLLLVSDEVVPGFMNFNNSPNHIIGYQDRTGKLGTYAAWEDGTDTIITDRKELEYEYYDYILDGDWELTNRKDDPRVPSLMDKLLNGVVPNELRAELPEGKLQEAGKLAKEVYINWADTIQSLTLKDIVSSSDSSDDESENQSKKMYYHSFGGNF